MRSSRSPSANSRNLRVPSASIHPKMTGKVIVNVSEERPCIRFDIKAALLAKHAQHVVLISFSDSLAPVYCGSRCLISLAQWTKTRQKRLLAGSSVLQFAGSSGGYGAGADSPACSPWPSGSWRGSGSRAVSLMHLVLGCAFEPADSAAVVWLIHPASAT